MALLGLQSDLSFLERLHMRHHGGPGSQALGVRTIVEDVSALVGLSRDDGGDKEALIEVALGVVLKIRRALNRISLSCLPRTMSVLTSLRLYPTFEMQRMNWSRWVSDIFKIALLIVILFS